MTSRWKNVTLGDVCEIQRGGSPRPIDQFITEAENGINWIKIGDVAEGAKYITSTKEKIKPEGALRSRAVVEGDFLLTNSMSFGRPYILRTNGCIHDGWLVLRYDKEKLTEDYLYHVLSSDYVYAQFVKYASGAVVKNLNSDLVKRVEIPLPPLSEQRRIAAILDKADSLRAKRLEVLEQLDCLAQSIFVEMFGDPIENGKKWNVVNLSDICQSIWDIDHKMPKATDNGLPFISAKDLIGNGSISFADVKLISEHDFKNLSRRGIPRSGDIIYSRIGVNLGKARLVKVSFPFLASYSCCTIRPDESKVDARYLCHLLDSPFLLKQAHKGVRAIAVPDLGMGEIKNFKIILPPLERQKHFAQVLEKLDSARANHLASNVTLEHLTQSLQHVAFRGEM